jgi:gamma-glutamyltranspeptidase/glutathione hydrolase
MFCLFSDSQTRKVHGLNGSGRAPMSLMLDKARKLLATPHSEPGNIPLNSVLAVTTPGAAGGWVGGYCRKTWEWELSLEQTLTPTISLADNGFPVSEVSARLVLSANDLSLNR